MPKIHCSLLTLAAGRPLDERLRTIAEAGFDGVQTTPPAPRDRSRFTDLLAASALAASACGHLAEDQAAEPLFERAAEAGMVSLNLQVDGYWRDDAWHDARVRELLLLGERYDLPFFLETHRHRLTQDLRRTLALAERHPDLALCGDFSHYTVMAELRAPWPHEWREALYALARRCGEIHVRLNNGQSVQDPLPAVEADQREAFRALWSTASTARPDLLITTELLPAGIGYDQVDLRGRPVGDIWADSVHLLKALRHS